MKNFSEAGHAKYVRWITEGELWELVETVRENAKNNSFMDGVMDFELNEYSSHLLTNTANQ